MINDRYQMPTKKLLFKSFLEPELLYKITKKLYPLEAITEDIYLMCRSLAGGKEPKRLTEDQIRAGFNSSVQFMQAKKHSHAAKELESHLSKEPDW